MPDCHRCPRGQTSVESPSMTRTMMLSQAEVASCVSVATVTDWVEHVFREWGNGDVVMPAKITLDMARSGIDSWSNAMPAYLVSEGIAGMKWVGGFPANAATDLPYIMGIIVLTDTASGHTLAVMDGGHITTERTGASAAVSVRHLASMPVLNVAIVGAGGQGRSCATYLHALYPDAAFRVADIDSGAQRAFVAEMSASLGTDIQPTDSEQAIRGADVIVIVTTATRPFIRSDWIGPGATVLAMSSFQQIEADFALAADKIVPDSWEQARHRGELEPLAESGQIDRTTMYAEIGDVVAGKVAGRAGADERILVAPVGLGAHDVYIAAQVYREATGRRLGTPVEL